MTDLYTRRRSIWCYAWRQRSLWAMSIPGIVLCVTFSYLPMWGILISFKKYSLYSGFFASRWVGLRYFQQFFNDVFAVRVIINTFLLSFYNLLFSFPMPIFLALLLNEMRLPKFKKNYANNNVFAAFHIDSYYCRHAKDIFFGIWNYKSDF